MSSLLRTVSADARVGGRPTAVNLADPVRYADLLRGVRKFGMHVMDPAGLIRSWNAGGALLTGYNELDVVGQPFSALLAPSTAPGSAERMLEFARTHGHHRSESRRRRRDGSEFLASGTIDALTGPDGKLIGFLEIFDDITERREREALLYQQATRDTLTGLLNRGHFVELGQVEIARAQRFLEPVSLVMIDLDHFKTVNDTYGHLVGDQVLAGFAQRLVDAARRTDYVGRLGGEEFGMLLPRADADPAIMTAERIRNRIVAEPFDTEAGQLRITASLGVATLTPSMHDLTDLMRSADNALYRAKHEGRDRAQADTC